jgi:formylglycine-generating enzyme required for sulfatase activity
MGSLHGSSDQMPPHKIKIHKSFAITAYEITFSQYDAFVKDMSYRKPNDYGWGRGELPVINVSLHDAIVYASWLSKKTKRRFRLPTETEWEYVARTGFKDKLGFKDIMGLGDANCDGCRYFWQRERTVEVGSFEANKYGVYDLFGNVWEWTCSIYTQRYDGQESYCADEKILEGKTMAVRGGSWDSFNQLLRAYVRFNNFPTYRGNKQGFRLIEEIN